MTRTKNCHTSPDNKSCIDLPVDYLVDSTLKHQQYDEQKFYNDIALVKVKKKIEFAGNVFNLTCNLNYFN